MEFLILGPLEVRENGGALPLPGSRQRAVLALLLLHADQVVSRDRLIEELWSPRAPENAPALLQVYVSRLRKAVPPEILLTQPPGYRLRTDPDQVDARRFERLLDDGRRAHADGDPAAARAVLSEALGLWRGPALADFAYESFAQAEIARLEELRLEATEARIEADLALGADAALVGEIEALVAADPLRERLRGHLMLALYRSGRQADALAAYRSARSALVEQLGIEPSPALRRLEREILAQDPALEPRGEAIALTGPASAEPPEDAEVRKVVTVLFTEVVERSGLAGSGPERIGRVMERFFQTAADVVARHGGTVDAFVADSLSAVFGVPSVHEDDALRAVRAALDLRDAVADLNDELDARWGVRIGIRSGVSTGEAVAGAGDPRRGLVTGDAVLVARRLQWAAGPGEILVGERTATAISGAFELTAGAPEGRRVVRALSWSRPRGVTGLRPVFVGREQELDLLEATYRRAARDRQPQLVTVIGEPGVGKSALLGALRDHSAGVDPAPRFRVGRCPAYGSGITYRPLGEILREELGVRESDPPEILRRELEGREILALSAGLDVPPGMHPVAARERLHAEWVAFLEEAVSERPMIMVVEDVNWAEDPLLDLLEHLARSVSGPLAVVVTARPELLERRPDWGAARRNSLRIWLEPLEAGEAERLLAGLVGPAVAGELGEAVLSRSEGNPFFIEELVATLVDRGVLRRNGDGWTMIAPPEGIEIPDSVQAVLAARMELLAAPERAALQTAGAIGRVFWEAPVRLLTPGEEPDFARLEERGFVRAHLVSSLAGERELAFRHALTCEVALGALPTPRRARLHAGFAGWLEETGSGRDEHAHLLAHHYAEAIQDPDLAWEGADEELARLRAKALEWLRRAAELATRRCAVEEAVGLLHRALELEAGAAGRADLWRRIAHASAIGYDGESFYPAMERAIELTSDPGALADLYSELALETTIRPAMWIAEPDPRHVDGMIERALHLTTGQRTPARARALVASSCWQPALGEAEAHEAAALAETLHDVQLLSQARGAEFKSTFASGRVRPALEAARRRLELEEAITDPEERGFIHWDLALANLAVGQVEAAAAEALRHDEIVSGLSAHHAVHGAGLLVMIHELTGRWEVLRALADEVEREVEENPATGCTFNARSLLACALGWAHAGDESRAAALEARADAYDPARYGLTAVTPRLRLALLRGDLTAVERILGEAGDPMYFGWLDAQAARLDALAALGDGRRLEAVAPRFMDPGTYLEPFALRALGLVREDERLVARAVERFTAIGLEWHAAQTRALASHGPGRSAQP